MCILSEEMTRQPFRTVSLASHRPTTTHTSQNQTLHIQHGRHDRGRIATDSQADLDIVSYLSERSDVCNTHGIYTVLVFGWIITAGVVSLF